MLVHELIARLRELKPTAEVKVASDMSSYNERAIRVDGSPESSVIWVVGEEDTGD